MKISKKKKFKKYNALQYKLVSGLNCCKKKKEKKSFLCEAANFLRYIYPKLIQFYIANKKNIEIFEKMNWRL